MLFVKKLLEKLASHFWVVTAGASLLVLGLYLYIASPGLAGTADTYHYLSAAYSLQTTGHLLTADGRAFTWWPPLFVVVLSIIGASSGVQWLNGLALLGSLAAWSAVGHRLLPARRAWALPLLLALSSTSLAVSKFIWSESLFNLLWASYFLVMLAWLRRGGWQLGLLATVLGCLLPLQRIAGLFLVAGVGAGLAWSGFSARRVARPSRLMQLAHVLSAGSGLAMWYLCHSLSVNNTFGSPLSLPQAAADYGFVLSRWLVPLPAAWLQLLPPMFWLVVLLVICLLLRPRSQPGLPTGGEWPGEWVLLSTWVLYAAFGVMLVVLIISVMRARAGRGLQEAERYVTALYPPLMLLVLLAWPAQRRWAAWLGPGLLGFLLLYQGVRVVHSSQHLRQVRPIELTYPHPDAWGQGAGPVTTAVPVAGSPKPVGK